MKTISEDLKAHLKSECTTLAWLIRMERKDGVVYGFTTHDHDLVFDGATYRASTAIWPTTVESSSANSVDNMDFDGLVNSDSLIEDELMMGYYDGAKIEVHIVNYESPTMGSVVMRRAVLGEVKMTDGKFTASVRGMHEKLQKTVGRYYTPTCTAKLFDGQCKLKEEDYAVELKVKTGGKDNLVLDGELPGEPGDENGETGYFTFGYAEALTGNNRGVKVEIKADASVPTDEDGVSERRLTFFLEFPYDFQPGDTVKLVPGCDRNHSTCKGKWLVNNVLNFRGFPHIPGADQMAKYPDNKYGI